MSASPVKGELSSIRLANELSIIGPDQRVCRDRAVGKKATPTVTRGIEELKWWEVLTCKTSISAIIVRASAGVALIADGGGVALLSRGVLINTTTVQGSYAPYWFQLKLKTPLLSLRGSDQAWRIHRWRHAWGLTEVAQKY